MSIILGGTNPAVTFPDATIQNTAGALPSQVIGINQTTASYTGSRALGTVYTNSTANTIVVYGSISNATANAITLCTINSLTIQGSSVAAAGANYYAPMLIVPAGATYSLNMNGTPVLQAWYETR